MIGKGKLKKVLFLAAVTTYGVICMLLPQLYTAPKQIVGPLRIKNESIEERTSKNHVSPTPSQRSEPITRNDSIEDWANQILIEQFSIKNGLDALRLIALESITDGKESKNLTDKIVKIHAALEAGYSQRKKQPRKKTIKRNGRPEKSLAFIKTYKVGGTLMSSLLSTYVYNYDLNIDPSEVWSTNGRSERKYNTCVDVTGTHHPPKGFYKNVNQSYIRSHFCNDPVVFMIIRNPIERLWSAYSHDLRTQMRIPSIQRSNIQVGQGLPVNLTSQGRQRPSKLDNLPALKGRESKYSLTRFLKTSNIKVHSAPHTLLAETLSEATSLLPNITVFSSDKSYMDVSLMLLAERGNLDVCDILYEPCNEGNNLWSTSKCNDWKSPLNDPSLTKILQSHAATSDEVAFYDLAMAQFKEEIQKTDLQNRLEQYLRIRETTLKACSTPTSYMAWESVFFADPLVHMTPDNRWVVSGENYYSIVPTWVCMQALCREMQSGRISL